MCSFRLRLLLVLSVLYSVVFSQNTSARNFNSDCDQVFTKRQLIIESSRYPSNYPLNFQCSYLIKGPSCNTRFNLQFLDFSIEDSLGCWKDRLEIDDKDAVCGNKNKEMNYYSDKGALLLKFISDNDTTGRGYRILVTRSSCLTEESSTQIIPQWYTTNNDVEYTSTTAQPAYNENNRKCCKSLFNTKQFTLTSPDFPFSLSSSTDCVYEIHKANENTCRLRIEVQFFWLGRTNSCEDGFLEIDGKFFCGCKSDMTIIAPFHQQPYKTLRFFSKGYERASYSGFVMNIIQDDCPKKVIPQETDYDPNQSRESTITKLHLINENTEIIAENNSEQLGRSQPQVFRHFYFYSLPDFNRIPKDREETEYVDTSNSNPLVQDNSDYNTCRNWNQFQFNGLSLRNLPMCKSKNENNSVTKRQCLDLNNHFGYFKSPGYPFYYPGNSKICYRFQKLPGYCNIRVHMKDFNLQMSNSCESDYLLFTNNMRYCGAGLANTISTANLQNKPYVEMNFVTDPFFCGRGFLGSYEQIPCEEVPNPVNPRPTPPDGPQARPCSRSIQEESFILDVFDYNEQLCSFTIKKHTEGVCFVKLSFEQFDLVCASESLIIDGTMYCGHLTGKSVTINVMNREAIAAVYRRTSNAGVNGQRLRIVGLQLSDDCPEPEVPAERFFKPTQRNQTHFGNGTQILLKLDRNFKNVCGIIVNRKKARLPETFCEILMRNDQNVKTCLPLKENSLFVPLGSERIELKISNSSTTEEIAFQEVDCGSLKV